MLKRTNEIKKKKHDNIINYVVHSMNSEYTIFSDDELLEFQSDLMNEY